eukprot:1179389-Prorocentrum_minimum.AAC.1
MSSFTMFANLGNKIQIPKDRFQKTDSKRQIPKDRFQKIRFQKIRFQNIRLQKIRFQNIRFQNIRFQKIRFQYLVHLKGEVELLVLRAEGDMVLAGPWDGSPHPLLPLLRSRLRLPLYAARLQGGPRGPRGHRVPRGGGVQLAEANLRLRGHGVHHVLGHRHGH